MTLLPGTSANVEVTTTRHWSFAEATVEHRTDDGVLRVKAGSTLGELVSAT